MPGESTETDISSLRFEAALDHLNAVVSLLESGQLTLDETIEQFRRGSELAAHCQQLIAEAELQITELLPVPPPDAEDQG